MHNKTIDDIRVELDEAITYGDCDIAMTLAADGLNLARQQKNLAEQCYFSGQMKLLHEEYPSALDYFDRAIDHNPQDGASYNDRALCMIELGTLNGAMEYFDKGIAVEPTFATIHHNKGWFLNKLGQHNEALSCFEKALALDANRAVTYENAGNAYEHLGDSERAKLYYQQALLHLKPHYPHIREALEQRIAALS